ncbi:structural protein [Morganella psychrotolerans]|uniref:Structural protein n=1 Tax=Morganella psychrotolerans TaxID=368603 RepID=A0A1B8HTW8_9GAMM|nr:structural protein [Morganella psychrotolerans]OBU13327.1 structural protein [Morganella psychrotolerans]
MTKPARGERNNNPGNIDYNPRNPWQGQLPHDPKIESRFCRFQSPEYGVRAIYKLLQTYQTKYGLNSVAAIINKYAPPNENPTGNYIKRAAADIGVGINDPINTKDKKTGIALATAIVGVELGYLPYSPDVFERAWGLL